MPKSEQIENAVVLMLEPLLQAMKIKQMLFVSRHLALGRQKLMIRLP